LTSLWSIDPALPDGDRLRFNSSVHQTIDPPESAFLPSATASIGIIGGAHGPTAIFFIGRAAGRGNPTGMHGLPLHSCVSIPAFSEDEPARFMIEGIDIKKHDSTVFQFGGLE